MNAEINVVPYIDVMLVLLIIFMVTAPLLTQGIEVQLPEANAQSLSSQNEDVIFSVTADGRFLLNVGDKQSQALDDTALEDKVRTLMTERPEQMILVEGDAKVPYEHVARGMAILRSAGVTKIGFVTTPAEAKPGRGSR
ncbi:protein TolR [Solimonas aquatica]|nr:protein TolR [Solimonas aquatica]